MFIRVVALFLALILPASAQTVNPSFFGMNFITPFITPAPPFYSGVARLLSTSYNGQCVQWSCIETSRGVYNWTSLDAIVTKFQSIKMIYAFVSVPGWANGNAGAAVPPTSFQDFYDFATAVATRYAGRGITYELWNEMNTTGTWTGTVAQMVTLAANACAAIHAADSTAVVATPTTTNFSGFAYMDSFLSGGGTACVDVVAIHGYPIWETPNQAPEQIWNITHTYAAMASYYGLSSKPILNTEGSWANAAGNVATAQLQQAYVPIYLSLFAAAGYQSQSWWEWDYPGGQSFGTLYNSATGGMFPAGIAYQQAESWLIGATFSSGPTRQAKTSGIRNPGGSGAVAGTGGTCSSITHGTLPTNWSVSSSDPGIFWSLVDSGTEGGINYVDIRFCGTPTGSGFVSIDTETSNHIAATDNQMWTFCVNTKLAAGSASTGIGWGLGYAENNSSGTFLNNPLSFSFNAFPYPLATQQQCYAGVNVEASTAFVQPYVYFGYTISVAFDETIRLGGATMDNGSVWLSTLNRGQIVWDANGVTATSSFSTAFPFYRDINGTQHQIIGGAVTLTNSPIFLNSVFLGHRLL